MENIIRNYKEQFQNNHRQRRKYACLLGVLALLVCLAVFWRLKLVGTAMTNEASCGLQEHTHTEDCYTDVLVCGYDDAAVAAGEHEHTDACYEHQLTCELPEHTHTADCYSDTDADTETEAVWMASYPQGALTGDWAQDTVMIAASQMNYAESTRNWQLAEDGTRRGYTRYGAWYGNPYGDWNGMFAAFCLHYAGVDESYLTTANAAGANSWSVALYQAGQLQGPGHTAVPGDVVFLGNDSTAESCAIVMDNDGTQLTLAAGDVNNTVAELTIPADSASILGYAATADAYAAYEAAHQPTPTPEEPAETPAPTAEPTENVESPAPENTPENAEKSNIAVTLEGDGTAAISDGINLTGGYTEDGTQSKYVQSIKGGTTVYEKDDVFKTSFDMALRIPKTELIAAGGKAYFDLPEKIKITDDLINDTWKTSSDQNAKYRFVKNADGTNRIEIQFDESYLNNSDAQYIFVQSLAFTAEAGYTSETTKGDVVFSFSDDITCTIPRKDITYPKDETLDYDIKTDKTGTLSLENNTLSYTATISSKKGTPDSIHITDTLRGLDGLKVKECRIKSIKKYIDGTETTVEASEYKSPFTTSEENRTFKLDLPGLPQSNGTVENKYVIEYEYVLDNIPGNTDKTANNTIKASAKNEIDDQPAVSDEKSASIKVKKDTISKGNWVDSTNKKIHWTVTVNGSYLDIAGKTLTDDMFNQIVSGTLKIAGYDSANQPLSDVDSTYDIQYTDGKISGIEFKAVGETGKNTNKYVITYDTPYTPSATNQTITNNASFDGTGSSSTANVGPDGSLTKTADLNGTPYVYGNEKTIQWTATLVPPQGGLVGSVITDTMSVKDSSKQWHYMTKAQAQELKTALDNALGTDGYENLTFMLQGADSTTLDNFPEDGKATSYSFTLKRAGTDTLTWKYTTTADLTNGEAGKNYAFRNQIEVEKTDLKATADVDTKKLGAVKGVVGGKANITLKDDNKDATFMWYVQVYCENNSEHTYTVSDALPEGVELVSVGVGVSKDAGKITDKKANQRWIPQGNTLVRDSNWSTSEENSKKLIVDTTADKTYIDGNTVTVTVNKPTTYTGDHFFVVFECKLSASTWDSIQWDTAKPSKQFSNTATVTRDGGEDYGRPSSTLTVNFTKTENKTKVLDKAAQWKGWDDNHTYGDIDYTVTINPEGKTLLPNGNGELTLKDQLDPSGAWNNRRTLVANSVILYQAVKGADGKLTKGDKLDTTRWKFAYDPSKNSLTVNVPDSMALILEYTYRIQYTNQSSGNKEDTISVKNEATLEGVANSGKENTETKEKWEKSSSYMTLGNAYTFYKVDSKNQSIYLPGAKFGLYKYNSSTGKFDDEPCNTFTTDANGRFEIAYFDKEGNSLEYNTAYYVKEIGAPKGYELPANPTKYYFYFSNDEKEEDGTTPKYPNAVPSGFPWGEYSNAIDLARTSSVAQVTNSRVDMDLTVKKVWADGTSDAQKNATVTVDLKRMAVPLSVWNEFYNQTATLTAKAESESIVKTQISAYKPGTTVHIKYEQARHYRDTPLNVQFEIEQGGVINTVTPVHTGYSETSTQHPEGYDVFEYDLTITEDTTVKAIGGVVWNKTSESSFTLSASNASTDDQWQANVMQNLETLKKQYASEPVQELKVNAQSDAKIYGLPVKVQSKGTDEEKRYIYYVEEQPTAGFVPSVTLTGDKTTMNYTFTITNTPTTTYELPKTGGRGTMGYVAGGAALMAVSLLCGYFKKRKKDEGRQNG